MEHLPTQGCQKEAAAAGREVVMHRASDADVPVERVNVIHRPCNDLPFCVINIRWAGGSLFIPTGRQTSTNDQPQPMSRPTHYSPVISRFVVSVLYHEARHRRIPMTRLTDELLLQALRGTPGWQTATSLRITDDSASNTPAPGIAHAA